MRDENIGRRGRQRIGGGEGEGESREDLRGV